METKIPDLLIQKLLRGFPGGRVKDPQSLTEQERDSFVMEMLEQASIVPRHVLRNLLDAGSAVVSRWGQGDLAEAVRSLSAALEDTIRLLAGEPVRQKVFIICQGGLVQEVVGVPGDGYEICDCDAFEDVSEREAEEYFDGRSAELKTYLRTTAWNKELPKSRRDNRSQL